MKKLLILLAASATLGALHGNAVASESPLITKWTESSETTIINHKKGWATVLTLKGDRGTGLEIVQGNKQATGIVMKSGNAQVTLSPSYVAAGVPSNEDEGIEVNRETTAVVFELTGAKLDGADGTFIALDAKNKKIIWIDSSGAVVGEVEAQ